MFKNTSGQKVTVYAVDASTGLPKTGDGGNITVYVVKDDGTVTVLGDTSATEADATNAKGDYLFDLTQTETNADKLRFTGKSTTSNVVIVPQTIYTTPASLHLLYSSFENGTAQAGGPSTITLRAGVSAVNDFYKDQVITILSGTGAGQTNRISSYDGTSKIATVETAWVTQPDNTSVYLVLGRVG
jgi:hypothetical protein